MRQNHRAVKADYKLCWQEAGKLLRADLWEGLRFSLGNIRDHSLYAISERLATWNAKRLVRKFERQGIEIRYPYERR